MEDRDAPMLSQEAFEQLPELPRCSEQKFYRRFLEDPENDFVKGSFGACGGKLAIVRIFNVCSNEPRYPNTVSKDGKTLFVCYPTPFANSYHESVKQSLLEKTDVAVIVLHKGGVRFWGMANVSEGMKVEDGVRKYAVTRCEEASVFTETGLGDTRKSERDDDVAAPDPKKQRVTHSTGHRGKCVRYAGRVWDSLLEVRHCIFWERLGLAWRPGLCFEIPKFNDVTKSSYTMDAYLPSLQACVEIKPCYPTEEAKYKCEKVAELYMMRVILLYGEMYPPFQMDKSRFDATFGVKGLLWSPGLEPVPQNVVWCYRPDSGYMLDVQRGTADTAWAEDALMQAYKHASRAQPSQFEKNGVYQDVVFLSSDDSETDVIERHPSDCSP